MYSAVSILFSNQPVPFHFPIQGRAVDLQALCCLLLIPVGFFQDFQDQILFVFLQRSRLCRRKRILKKRFRKIPGRDLIRLETENPFATEPSRPDIVRFVSILLRPGRGPAEIPFALPPRGEWLVRVIGSNRRFVFGMYRRRMRTIGYLGQIDKRFGVPTTIRNWNTILAVVRILKGQDKKAADKSRRGVISR